MSDQSRRRSFAARRGWTPLLTLLVLLLAPLWSSGLLHAQSACPADDPCPSPPSISVSMPATMSTETPTANVRFTVANIRPGGAVTPTATVNGAAVTPVFLLDANGYSGSGTVAANLGSGPNSVVVHVTDGVYSDSAATTVTYAVPPTPPARDRPIATVQDGSQYRRSFAGCAGCANTTLAYSTPAYRSRDEDRTLSLIYSSALSAPVGIVTMDVNPNSSLSD